VAVRYLRYGRSYREVEELLAERGVDVHHVTIYRWVPALHRRVVVHQPRAEGRAGVVPPGTGHRAVLVEVTTDRAPAYPRILDEFAGNGPALIPSKMRQQGRSRPWPNSRPGSDRWRSHDRRSTRIIATGHAFVQNLRRGHYDIATDAPGPHRPPAAFDELALAI